MTANQLTDDWDQPLNENDNTTSSRRTSMRYATVVMDAGPDEFYPDHQVSAERAAITHERIHRLHLLDDGTVVELLEIRADLEKVAAELDAQPHVLHYDVAGTEDGIGLVYEHIEATDATASLLALLREFELILDPPLEVTDDGAIRVTLLGDETALQGMLTAASDIVDIHLEQTGEYKPEGRDLASRLTDRQHQILTMAVAKGYYTVPREASISDIANEVDLSQSTVGEHLQKIEAKILSEIVR